MKSGPKVPFNRLRQQAREWYAEQFPEGEPSEPPRIVNAREAAGIDRPVTMAYRGKPYTVRPIPFEAGAKLQALMQELRDADGTDGVHTMREMVALFGTLAYRRGWRGWFRWLTPNPFRKASAREIWALLDFFWKCQTGQSLRVLAARGAVRQQSTPSTASSSSGARTVTTR